MKTYCAIISLFLCMYSQLLSASNEEQLGEITFQINCDFKKQITKYGEEVIPKREGYGGLVYISYDGPAPGTSPLPNDPILFSEAKRHIPKVREVTGFDGSRHFIIPSSNIHFKYNSHIVIHKDGAAVKTTITYDEELIVVSEIGTCEVTN